jgi:hypothetical protein
MSLRNPREVIAQLWRSSEQRSELQNIFVILDTSRNPKIYPMLKTSYADYTCLYKGDIPKVLAEVAPYLVRLEEQSRFTEWIISEGWGDNWGILCDAPASAEHLRRHFRQFLMAQIEGGPECYFRFYDPRVFRVYLPSCNSIELEDLFGPVTRFFVEGEDRNTLVEYSLAGRKLSQKTIALNAAPNLRMADE